jgi:hypothetical protein
VGDSGGWEYNLVLIGSLAALAVIGAGAWSLDRAIGLARAEGTAGAERLPVGVPWESGLGVAEPVE